MVLVLFSIRRLGAFVGEDVTKTIKDFFASGYVLKQMNCTILDLVLKCSNPTVCKNYHPISYCNTIYKSITKILENKFKGILSNFVCKAQVMFVEGRKIGDNILLCQEIMHMYDKVGGNHSRCAIKDDLFKAYDMVRWDLLIMVLKSIDFHLLTISWIMEYVKTVLLFGLC